MGDGVMIALLPITSDWCKIDYPHMTLVFAGKVDELVPTEFNEMAKDAASIAMLSSPLYLRVTGKQVFGDGSEDNPHVDVFTLLATPELQAMRRQVEQWNKSEFPFTPHVTIGPAGSFVESPPAYLAFDRIVVGWGDEYLTFWLKR